MERGKGDCIVPLYFIPLNTLLLIASYKLWAWNGRESHKNGLLFFKTEENLFSISMPANQPTCLFGFIRIAHCCKNEQKNNKKSDEEKSTAFVMMSVLSTPQIDNSIVWRDFDEATWNNSFVNLSIGAYSFVLCSFFSSCQTQAHTHTSHGITSQNGL